MYFSLPFVRADKEICISLRNIHISREGIDEWRWDSGNSKPDSPQRCGGTERATSGEDGVTGKGEEVQSQQSVPLLFFSSSSFAG